MKNQLAESIHMEFNDNSVLSSLFGVSDSNIQLLEKINNVKIEYRGNVVKISGNKYLFKKQNYLWKNFLMRQKRVLKLMKKKLWI